MRSIDITIRIGGSEIEHRGTLSYDVDDAGGVHVEPLDLSSYRDVCDELRAEERALVEAMRYGGADRVEELA